jgi:hypothetical protein
VANEDDGGGWRTGQGRAGRVASVAGMVLDRGMEWPYDRVSFALLRSGKVRVREGGTDDRRWCDLMLR